ncbi:14.7 kDa heat shock protein [Cardamine amara subsp. amara]|uniref:14.7 kDa heat shock protein n=1 Tax=Cardamine amara subsp. amara TaxID=228776 RepID=A0ABD1B4Y8_CARAN
MNEGSSGESSFPRRLNNPFQKSGSETVYEVTETSKAIVMRVDIPGSVESDLTHWFDASNVHFFADEPHIPEYENSGRKYGGTLGFNPACYDVKSAKVKLINGVLWVTIPKIPGQKANIDVIEKFLYIPI